MDKYFNIINEYLFSLLNKEEILKTSLWGENSQFIRLNNSKVRQTGIIDDMSYSISLIFNNRQVSCSTTLNGNITSSATTVTLTDASNFPTSGYIVIRKVLTSDDTSDPVLVGTLANETIQYTGKSSNDLTGCTRGTAAPYRGETPVSTTARSHTSGAKVFGSHKIVSRVATTVAQAGVPSTVTQYNSFTLTLASAASTTETGGGINCVVGPVNQRRA